ncbi:MAG TPA: hypothetical protein VMN39_09610 [Longimicrobiaceae bacterium]|nr:hypothetical protein [Longimicrobiaceae bacterium]
MDWFTILLIFVFFVLPLLQKVVERSKKADAERADESLEEAELEGLELQHEAPRSRPRPEVERPRPRPEVERGWSEGWASWPGLETEPEEAAEEAIGPAAADRPRDEPRVISYEPVRLPEARRESPGAPVESPTRYRPVRATPLPTPVARSAPIERQTRAIRVPSPARLPGPVRLARSAGETRSTQPTAAARRLGLSSSAELRRAIVVCEVLGPPVALRQSERAGA